jgi:hypothetical protein
LRASFHQIKITKTRSTNNTKKNKNKNKNKRILVSLKDIFQPKFSSIKINSKENQLIVKCLTQNIPTLITQVSVLIENLADNSKEFTIR